MTGKSNLDKYTVILLAGNSIYPNKLWLERLSTELKTVFKNIIKHVYTHWETGESLINLDNELQKLKKNIVSLDINNYIIIAKSAGVLLSLKGIYERIISPTRCVFLGTPISWAYQNGFDIDLWLKKYIVSTLFIQEREDPITTYKELNTYLKSNKAENYSIQQIEGNTHNYDNFSAISKSVNNLLKYR